MEPPMVKTLRLAGLLIFQIGAEETDRYMRTNKEKLAGLAPSWSKGVFGSPGGWVTRGRLWKGIFSILGVHELPILLPETQPAYLLMYQAHEEDHKGLQYHAMEVKEQGLGSQGQGSSRQGRERMHQMQGLQVGARPAEDW